MIPLVKEAKEGCEQGIQDAWGEWVRMAERELVNHFGLHEEEEKYIGRVEEARFRTLPVLGWHGTKREGATSAKGAVTRVVANRLGEVCKLYWVCRRKLQDGKGRQRENHLRELCKYAGSYINRAVCNGHLLEIWVPRARLLQQWGWAVGVIEAVEVLTVARWCAEARAIAEAEEEQAKWKRLQSWSCWAKKACEEGASKGHRWIKGPSGWNCPSVEVDRGEVSYSPSDVANECMDEWRGIWEGGNPPAVEELWWDDEPLPAVRAEDIKESLKEFKKGTGVGLCNWNPRDWGKISDEGLEVLAKLLNRIEEEVCWPKSVLNTVLVRLPKQESGHRLIGLMGTLYRVWAKVRRQYCQSWEEKHSRCYDFACKGRGAIGEMWDVALTDEGARHSGAATLAWAADLSKFYERMPHGLLLRCAKEMGFHPVVARLAIFAYGGNRRIRVDGGFSRSISVGQGIIAGCSLATSLVKVFMWKALDLAYTRFPMIKLRVYLDDLLLQRVGKPGNFRYVHIGKLVEAILYYADVIQLDWKGKINTEKTCFISSDRSLLALIGKELQGKGIALEQGCRMLGLDYNAGRRHKRKVLQARMKEGTRRGKRGARLKKPGANAGRLWVTVTCPSITYGCEVYGVNGNDLSKVRKMAGAACLPGGGGGRSLS